MGELECYKCAAKCYEGNNAQFSANQIASYDAVSGDTRATLEEMEHGQDHIDNAQISMSNYSNSDKENTPDNSYFSNNSQKGEDFSYDRQLERDQESNKTVELNTIENELEKKDNAQVQLESYSSFRSIPQKNQEQVRIPVENPQVDIYPKQENEKAGEKDVKEDLEEYLAKINKEQKSTS